MKPSLNKQICIAISSAVLVCSLGYANLAFAKLANQKDQNLFEELEYGSNEGKSRPEVIEALLKAGANVNAKDNGGVTPLSAALLEDDTTTAEILVKHGADVNVKIKEDPLIYTHDKRSRMG